MKQVKQFSISKAAKATPMIMMKMIMDKKCKYCLRRVRLIMYGSCCFYNIPHTITESIEQVPGSVTNRDEMVLDYSIMLKQVGCVDKGFKVTRTCCGIQCLFGGIQLVLHLLLNVE